MLFFYFTCEILADVEFLAEDNVLPTVRALPHSPASAAGVLTAVLKAAVGFLSGKPWCSEASRMSGAGEALCEVSWCPPGPRHLDTHALSSA